MHKIETQKERSEKMNRLMPIDLKLYKIENLHKDVNIKLKIEEEIKQWNEKNKDVIYKISINEILRQFFLIWHIHKKKLN